MGNLYESLKNYFENTPKDVIEKDWKEMEHLNEIGPDAIEYAEFAYGEFIRKNPSATVSYSNSKENK